MGSRATTHGGHPCAGITTIWYMATSPLPDLKRELPADCRRPVVKRTIDGFPVPCSDCVLPAPVSGFLTKSWKSKKYAPEQARTQTSKYLLLPLAARHAAHTCALALALALVLALALALTLALAKRMSTHVGNDFGRDPGAGPP